MDYDFDDENIEAFSDPFQTSVTTMKAAGLDVENKIAVYQFFHGLGPTTPSLRLTSEGSFAARNATTKSSESCESLLKPFERRASTTRVIPFQPKTAGVRSTERSAHTAANRIEPATAERCIQSELFNGETHQSRRKPTKLRGQTRSAIKSIPRVSQMQIQWTCKPPIIPFSQYFSSQTTISSTFTCYRKSTTSLATPPTTKERRGKATSPTQTSA